MMVATYKKYFENKSIVITGASSGIGALLAYHVAKYGGNIVLIARNEERLQATMEQCKSVAQQEGYQSHISYVVSDLSDANQVSKTVDYIHSCFDALDVLVANAGMSMHARIEDTDNTVYQKMLQANYFSAVNIIIPLLALLKKNHAVLTVVSSIQSLIGVPNHAAYVASKHALAGFLESLELEEPDINVVEIITGWVSGTNIRSNALDGRGNSTDTRGSHIQRHSRSSISVEVCVDAILQGIVKNKRLVFRPKFWRNILFVKYCMRRYLHWLIVRRQEYSSK